MERAMQHLNIPGKIIKIIVSAYSRAKITININGTRDGFLMPTQGLRQGCPMSPYVFIISMEILSRLLQGAAKGSIIKGVQVAHTSPQLTHAVYADDLVLMGDVLEEEVQAMHTLLDNFAKASGLHINPNKSGLWFSRACYNHEIGRVRRVWDARGVEGEEKYLGIMLGQKGEVKRNGALLLDKIRSKLIGWKSNMLSYAGRLVLIKAVLMSMPVYAMALEMLLKGIIKDINRILAKFFWGKTSQDRYMALIGWQRVCKPIGEGGLGVKDLEKFGEAMFLKVVWALLADEEKLWLKICKSKYYPTVGPWKIQIKGGCSKMWSQVIKKRDFFLNQVEWKINNGKKAGAICQPWFANWSVQRTAAPADRRLKVCSLVDGSTGDWNTQELVRLFDQGQVQSILLGNNKPVLLSDEHDKLIWLKSRRGRYTVREKYVRKCSNLIFSR